MPNMPTVTSSTVRKAPIRWRSFTTRRRQQRHRRARVCHQPNAARSTTPPASTQPARESRASPGTHRLGEAVDQREHPGRPEHRAGHVEARRRDERSPGREQGHRAEEGESRAMGMLTYRHQRQFRYWVRKPPRSSPTAAPAPMMAPKMPNALLRSLGSVKVVASSARADGASSAAKTPAGPRARTAIPGPRRPAAPPSAEAAAKPSKPAITKVNLRPNRSEGRPPSSRKPAKVSV